MISRREAALGLLSTAGLALAAPAHAASASALTRDGNTALATLYRLQPRAAALGKKAKGILVFPSIVKAGLIIGGQTGNGVFFENDVATSFYNISAASYGLQAGMQSFSYALFFMRPSAVSYLTSSHGWSVGAGPSVVVIDQGTASSVTSSTLTQDVYAVPFGQRGLMAGVGLEGSKITRIQPDA